MSIYLFQSTCISVDDLTNSRRVHKYVYDALKFDYLVSMLIRFATGSRAGSVPVYIVFTISIYLSKCAYVHSGDIILNSIKTLRTPIMALYRQAQLLEYLLISIAI